MEFKERIDEHVKLIKKYKDEDFKEEQTKMYLIAPFLNLLGYNVFNPDDVVAEFLLLTEEFEFVPTEEEKKILNRIMELRNKY